LLSFVVRRGYSFDLLCVPFGSRVCDALFIIGIKLYRVTAEQQLLKPFHRRFDRFVRPLPSWVNVVDKPLGRWVCAASSVTVTFGGAADE